MPILRVCIATVLAALLAACETTPQRAEVAAPKPDPTRSTMNNANSAYRNGDDALALSLYLPLARAGNRDAQIRVARIYSRNKGVPVNHGESCNWWETAARQDDANAANNVGRCFESGEGRSQSHPDAATWYRRAADGGSAYGITTWASHTSMGAGLRKASRSLPSGFAKRWPPSSTQVTTRMRNAI